MGQSTSATSASSRHSPSLRLCYPRPFDGRRLLRRRIASAHAFRCLLARREWCTARRKAVVKAETLANEQRVRHLLAACVENMSHKTITPTEQLQSTGYRRTLNVIKVHQGYEAFWCVHSFVLKRQYLWNMALNEQIKSHLTNLYQGTRVEQSAQNTEEDKSTGRTKKRWLPTVLFWKRRKKTP